MSRNNNQMMIKSLIIVNDRWVLRHPAVSLFMDWMTEKNYWDLFSYFSYIPPRGCLLGWWRKSGKWESKRNSGATGTRRFALSVCVRAWLHFPESCQDFVAWLLIIRVAPCILALPWIDWTCRTFELVLYLCIYIPHERNNVVIIRLFCFVLFFTSHLSISFFIHGVLFLIRFLGVVGNSPGSSSREKKKN